ncbi:glycoside hydrolase family 88 protein [Sodalis ligni]|uniref:glycoside hydrolase family 88 protein n=1 Tax=Sodalis ligni TaxID=2697027 RepID=UPI0014050D36|nr:glycoside hydrolase family 88 protein [Sodalis ligni]
MNWLDSAIQHCVTKTTLNSRKFKDFPHITEGGKYQFTLDGVWTGGFWTGLLWLCYEERGDPELLTAAKGFTERLLPRANDSRNHDLGFMFYPSAIAGWRLTGEESYHAAALNAAESLARQFNEAGGLSRAGDFSAARSGPARS